MSTGGGSSERPSGLLTGGEKQVYKDSWEHCQIWTQGWRGTPSVYSLMLSAYLVSL